MSPKDRRAGVIAYEFILPLLEMAPLRKHVCRGQGQGARIASAQSHRLIALIRSESAQAPVAAVDLIGKALHNHNKVRDSPKTLYGAINAAWREHHGLREGLPVYPKCCRNRGALIRLYSMTG
jgi:hypothetical protein